MQAYTDREDTSLAAANTIAAALDRRLSAADRATLVVSGGSTPGGCLAALSEIDIDWSRVRVMLTDERCVPLDDPASNERMVRETLIRGRAREARFVPLVAGSLESLATTFAVALVGMGEDGHFASLFPDLPDLATLSDVTAEPAVSQVSTSASPVPRLTMNLAALARADERILLVFGEAKRAIIEAPQGYPVEALLAQQPLTICWAP